MVTARRETALHRVRSKVRGRVPQDLDALGSRS